MSTRRQLNARLRAMLEKQSTVAKYGHLLPSRPGSRKLTDRSKYSGDGTLKRERQVAQR